MVLSKLFGERGPSSWAQEMVQLVMDKSSSELL